MATVYEAALREQEQTAEAQMVAKEQELAIMEEEVVKMEEEVAAKDKELVALLELAEQQAAPVSSGAPILAVWHSFSC